MKPEGEASIYHSYYNMRICGYVDMIFCIVTIISNTFIIAVFTRKTMVSPMNTIFIHIAITESLAVFSFIPRSWHEFFRVRPCSIHIHRTLEWESFALNSYSITIALRLMVVWLTVMLGVWRYIAVVHPLKTRQWCDMHPTQKWVLAGYVFGAVSTIPAYTCVAVRPSKILLTGEGCVTSNSTIGNVTTIYEFKVLIEDTPMLYSFVMISYGILIKSLPSIVLTVISFKLIVGLIKARKRRAVMVADLNREKIEKQMDRTTIILLLILALFIATEIPHGICATLTGILGPEFYWRYYYYIMEITNTFAHVSMSFNFVLYYAMSNQFRKTFKALFKPNDNVLSQIGRRISSVSQKGINRIGNAWN